MIGASHVVLEGEIFHEGVEIAYLVIRNTDLAFHGLHLVEANFQVNAQ